MILEKRLKYRDASKKELEISHKWMKIIEKRMQSLCKSKEL